MQLRFLKGWVGAKTSWLAYIASPFAVGAALVLYNSFEFSTSGKFPFIFFYPAILLVATIGGTGPGFLTLVLSALVAGYFLLPPAGWRIAAESDWSALFVFIAMASVMIALAAWGRSISRLATKARLELKAQENRYSLALENTPIIVYAQDLNLKYTWIQNPHARSTEDRVIGKTDRQLLPKDEADALESIKRRVLETGVGERQEISATLTEGKLIYDLMVQPLRDEKGQLIGIAGAAVDITQEKQYEYSLQEARSGAEKDLAQIEALYQQAPIGLCFIDKELRYVRINKVLAEWNGLSVEEHLGKRVDVVLPHLAESLVPMLQKIIDSRSPIRDLQLELLDNSTGILKHFNLNFDPVTSEAGEVQGVSAIIQDITEQVKSVEATQLLAEATKTLGSSLDYQTTLDRLARSMVPVFGDWCGVDVLEEDGTFNRVAVQHVDPKKIKWALEIAEKYPPDMDSATGVPAVLRTGKSELYEFIPEEMLRAAAKDEEHWKIIEQIGFTSAMVVPLVARGKVFGALTLVYAETKRRYSQNDLQLAEELGRRAGSAIDNARLFQAAQREIEDRKRAEAEVMRLVRELEVRVDERTKALRDAVEDLEGFCYSVSHDLRAPMRSLSANSRILLEDFSEGLAPEAQRHLERMAAAGSKMGDLIDDLLQFSRLGRTKLTVREIKLSDIAEQIATQLKAHYPAWRGEFQIEPELSAFGDPSILTIVLQNLLENAVKYSDKVESPRVEFGADCTESERIFYVRDNGIGFDMQYSAKIYQPFERLHRDEDYPGTGIGLANSRRIIIRHGGRLWAEAEVGKGATFFFTLGTPTDMPEPLAQDLRGDDKRFLS